MKHPFSTITLDGAIQVAQAIVCIGQHLQKKPCQARDAIRNHMPPARALEVLTKATANELWTKGVQAKELLAFATNREVSAKMLGALHQLQIHAKMTPLLAARRMAEWMDLDTSVPEEDDLINALVFPLTDDCTCPTCHP
jgi:hypothetical protein